MKTPSSPFPEPPLGHAGSQAEKPRLVFVTTDSSTARYLLAGQLAFLRRSGFDVCVISSPGPDLDEVERREQVPIHGIRIRREISPLSDLRSLAELTRILKRLRPVIVNAGTPKAGLLATLAAKRAGVPTRIYTVRGLRLETARGMKRLILKWSEKLASSAATRVLCVSESLRREYLSLSLAPSHKVGVLGLGSSNGVDVQRFTSPSSGELDTELEARLATPETAPVLGFVGRLTRDKGAEDLAEIFLDRLAESRPDLRLLVVGGFESGDPISAEVRARLLDHPRVLMTGFVEDIAPYYRLMDLLVFPSYREGLPNAPLEAAAAGLPVVGYAATGTVDAVRHGETGTLVPVGDTGALEEALEGYLDDSALRQRHGLAGRLRAERQFDQDTVWQLWLAEYRRLLDEPRPRAHQSLYQNGGKRLFDLLAAGLALVTLFPLLAVLGFLVRVSMGSPVMFRQRRPGRRGIPFEILKFRTMRLATDESGQPLPDADRVTGLGRFLRRSSLDELPELWNVLRGQMSLVGPRPLRMRYLTRYTPEQVRRHDVRPGITGWAQINGRNALTWEEKFSLDVWYVDHLGFGLDLRIMARTVLLALSGRGTSAPGHATMPEFMGSPSIEKDGDERDT